MTREGSLNDPKGYDSDPGTRRRQFEAVLEELFREVDLAVPELDWLLDRPRLRISSSAVVISGHPDRLRTPVWQVSPESAAWASLAPNCDAWRTWQAGIALLEEWVECPAHVAILARRILDRALLERQARPVSHHDRER